VLALITSLRVPIALATVVRIGFIIAIAMAGIASVR